MLLGITNDYFNTGAPVPNRLALVMGRGVPVELVRELDVKMDDGMPASGVVRATVNGNPTLFAAANNWGGSDAVITCVDTVANPNIYNTAAQSPDACCLPPGG